MMKPRAVTLVFWDIKAYPVPRGCDAGLVSWSISRYVKKLGYFGPLTIIAVGLLSDVSVDVLRVLSSTGILLNHVPLGSIGILRSMDAWKQTYPAPANMMLISSDKSILPRIRHSSGYNIRRLLPSFSINAWKRFLLRDSGEWTARAESPTYWLCSVCSNCVCPGFKNFTTHLSSKEHADEAIRVAMDAVASTWVLWDINRCPVPPGCDPRRVRPLIKQYLEDFGYSGSFTITATGLLTDVPRDVLRALSSTGIDFHNISFNSGNILNVMYNWMSMNPRPPTMLAIVPYSEMSARVVGHQREMGCNVIELFTFNSPYSESLWKKFLLEDSGTLEEEDKCSETGEHVSWRCSEFHNIRGKGFDNFITHLAGPEHEPEQPITVFWDIKGYPVPPYCDARHVCLSIKRYLEDEDYFDFTINAVGLLTDVPPHVLRAVSATGIILNHVPSDSADTMYHWASLNSPPAKMVVMCPYSETLAKAVDDLREQGYTITVPFQSDSHSESLWDKFLLRNDPGTLFEDEVDKCSETDASWVCSVCHYISGKGFENFITHLSQEHELKLCSLPGEEDEQDEGKQKEKLMKKDKEALDYSLPEDDLALVRKFFEFAAPSMCHEKNEVEAGVDAAILKKQQEARKPLKRNGNQMKKLKKKIKVAFEADDEDRFNSLINTASREDVKSLRRHLKKLSWAEMLQYLKEPVEARDASSVIQQKKAKAKRTS